MTDTHMFEKSIDFWYGDNDSEVLSLINPRIFEKRAGLSDELQDFIDNLKSLNSKTYALVNALSAGEYFGNNRNGDYFPEEALKQYHKTFEVLGHVYKHHVNKDPEKSLGKVLFSHYNTNMHRVELILELDNFKAKDVIDQLVAGGLPAVSMGARVPYDICSICNNKAKNRNEYCTHLKTQMGQILLGGKKVYAINDRPKFFDISIVVLPAEKTAGFIKVFKNLAPTEINSQEKLAFYNDLNYIKIAEMQNLAEIKKQVSSNNAEVVINEDPKKLVSLINHAQNRLDKDVLTKLSEFSLNEVLSTMAALRIMPTRGDFQKLALYSIGNKELADELESKNIVFSVTSSTSDVIPDNVGMSYFNEKVAEVLLPEIPKVSLTKELIISRELVKMAEEWRATPLPPERSLISRAFFGHEEDPPVSPEKNPIIPLGILGSLYYGYSKVFNNTNTSQFRNFMLNNPWLLPVLIGGTTVGTLWAQNKEFNKTAGNVDKFMRNSLISFPASYYMAGSYENKARKGNELSTTENFVRKNPALTALVASLAGVKAENMFKKIAGFVHKLPENKINDLYNDVLI